MELLALDRLLVEQELFDRALGMRAQVGPSPFLRLSKKEAILMRRWNGMIAQTSVVARRKVRAV
jgi:hypothetical protein